MPPRSRTDARDAQNPGPGDTVARTDPLIGAMLGDYQVLERIGEGGMGVVYRGVHPTIKKRVAIKVLKPSDDPQQARRLVTEAEAVNSIGDRHIIDIFGHGTLEDGRHYIVMEFLEGDSLEEHLTKSGGVPWQEACALLMEVCRPLQAAHSRGVIHRDLKPSNIFLVRQRDGSHYVKLLDFGLAKLTRSAFKGAEQSNAFEVNGTPAYMAPEQSRGQPVSAATDLYALGVIAFELLVGHRPFNADNPMDLMMAHIGQPPPPLAALAPHTPPLLQGLVQQLLEKEPGRRPASADVVRRQLDQARAQNITQSGLPTEELRATTFDVLAMQAAVNAQQPARGEAPRAAPSPRPADSGPTEPALAGGPTFPAGPSAPPLAQPSAALRREAQRVPVGAQVTLEREPNRLAPGAQARGEREAARPALDQQVTLGPSREREAARAALDQQVTLGPSRDRDPARLAPPGAEVTQQLRRAREPEPFAPQPSALRSAAWGGLAALLLALLAAAAWLALKPAAPPAPAPTPKLLQPAEPARGP